MTKDGNQKRDKGERERLVRRLISKVFASEGDDWWRLGWFRCRERTVGEWEGGRDKEKERESAQEKGSKKDKESCEPFSLSNPLMARVSADPWGLGCNNCVMTLGLEPLRDVLQMVPSTKKCVKICEDSRVSAVVSYNCARVVNFRMPRFRNRNSAKFDPARLPQIVDIHRILNF